MLGIVIEVRLHNIHKKLLLCWNITASDGRSMIIVYKTSVIIVVERWTSELWSEINIFV